MQLFIAASHTLVYLDNNSNFIPTYRFEGHFKEEIVLLKLLNFIVYMLKTELLYLGDRYVFVLHQLKADRVIVCVLLFYKIEREQYKHLAIVTLFYAVRF